jgi:hypothetical protein
MNKKEFLALPSDVIKFADRISSNPGDMTETQFKYLVATNGLDSDLILRTHEFIERTKTKGVFWVCLFAVAVLYVTMNLILRAFGV